LLFHFVEDVVGDGVEDSSESADFGFLVLDFCEFDFDGFFGQFEEGYEGCFDSLDVLDFVRAFLVSFGVFAASDDSFFELLAAGFCEEH
jgi:hypothetical protein